MNSIGLLLASITAVMFGRFGITLSLLACMMAPASVYAEPGDEGPLLSDPHRSVELTSKHYEQLRAKYPPKTHYVMGFGLTTALMGAVMRNKLSAEDYDHYFFERPVERFHSIPHDKHHLMLPDPEVLGDRTLVIYRTLIKGITVAHLESQLKKLRPNMKVAFYLIYDENPDTFDTKGKDAHMVRDSEYVKIARESHAAASTWGSRAPGHFMSYPAVEGTDLEDADFKWERQKTSQLDKLVGSVMPCEFSPLAGK